MKKLACFLAITLCAWAVHAAVTVTPSTVTLLDSSGRAISRGHADMAACTAQARARGPAVYFCDPLRSRVVVTADPPPAPVNCAVSDWSAWQAGQWSVCADGAQTRTETRTRSITTQPANGGAACPVLGETRTASQPCTVAPPPSGAENVGTWAQRDFSRPFRINMQPGSYPVWVAGGARHENVTGAWDGGNAARIYPPTGGQTYGGIGGFTLPSGVTSVALRWEMRTGPTYASGGQGFDDNKHVIFHTQNGNRPMFNIQPAGGGCLQAAIAQGTVKQFNQSAQGGSPASFFRGNGDYLFRWCDTAQARAVVPGEWITISLHVSCSGELHASGHIRAAVYRRGGVKVADWWIPWNYDSPARCTNMTGIEAIGDYYNGRGDGAAGTWFDIAGVTIATNSPILAPRAGF